jgi:hypothetical protein
MAAARGVAGPSNEQGLHGLTSRLTGRSKIRGDAEYSLYPYQAGKITEDAGYRVNAAGWVLSKGIQTRWRVKDLKDTGQTSTTFGEGETIDPGFS